MAGQVSYDDLNERFRTDLSNDDLSRTTDTPGNELDREIIAIPRRRLGIDFYAFCHALRVVQE